MSFGQRKNKFKAIRVKADGHVFDSKLEHKRWCELKVLLLAGQITALEVHPKLEVKIGDKPAFTYIADFNYIDKATGKIVWEDTKGIETAVFRLKKRLIGICYPDIDLRIVRA